MPGSAGGSTRGMSLTPKGVYTAAVLRILHGSGKTDFHEKDKEEPRKPGSSL